MIHTFCKTIVFLWAAVVISVSAAAAPFIEGFEDLPIPNGMTQMNSDNVSFGNEEARFVEAYLTSSKISFRAVESFYMDTLPQLGWTFKGKQNDVLHFYRDGENLDIAREGKKPLVVRITIRSQN